MVCSKMENSPEYGTCVIIYPLENYLMNMASSHLSAFDGSNHTQDILCCKVCPSMIMKWNADSNQSSVGLYCSCYTDAAHFDIFVWGCTDDESGTSDQEKETNQYAEPPDGCSRNS